MESLNRLAVELVDEAIDFADELNVDVFELDSGATVLDFGVEAAGGLEAGLLLAEIQTAGLATIQTRMDEVAGTPVEGVNTVDGFKTALADGTWLLVRPSGTEPKIRVYAEATSPERVEQLLAAGRDLVGPHV